MKVTVHLIPIPPPNPTSPDPPDTIYHYTTGSKLRPIINSGAIEPTTAKIEPNEKPVAWFSTSPLGSLRRPSAPSPASSAN